MYKAIGVIELKSIPKGVEAADYALKSAGIEMVSSHPACPGKYEIILTGSISNVSVAVSQVTSKFDGYVIDSSVMGRIDEQVIKALFGTQTGEREGSLGLIETFSAASAIRAADIAVKTARVETRILFNGYFIFYQGLPNPCFGFQYGRLSTSLRRQQSPRIGFG